VRPMRTFLRRHAKAAVDDLHTESRRGFQPVSLKVRVWSASALLGGPAGLIGAGKFVALEAKSG
jgi:hypothetical protein